MVLSVVWEIKYFLKRTLRYRILFHACNLAPAKKLLIKYTHSSLLPARRTH